MAELRLGVLGGTFNPIHLGHLVLAESFRECLALDRVLFVPAGTPPHKTPPGIAPVFHRYAMAALAVAGHPAFATSEVEVRRSGPSYSVDTLEALAGEWPGARLFFLMGSDTFLDLPTWRTPERLGAWATLAVGDRPGSAFVATFVGRANTLPGELVGGAAGTRAIVRPEAMRFAVDGSITGTVRARRFVGGFAFFTVAMPVGITFEVYAPHTAAKVGDAVTVAVDRVLFTADGRTGGQADGTPA